MKSHTAYMTFETDERRELVRITEDVQAAVDEAGIEEGMVLVAARTTVTPTSRTCWSTTRRSSR